MAASDFAISIDILDKNAPQILQVHAVDRAILSDKDVSFALDQLQSQSGAPVDGQPHKSYLGVDIFYGKDHAVKGLVFATQSRALAIRIPDGTAKLSAAKYEQKLAKPETAKEKPQQRPKGKSKPNVPPEISPYERLSNLLKSNLAAFGMAQISLTLWDTLRERVEGVNLSTAVSEKIPPPSRIVPDPNAPADADDTESPPKREKQGAGRGGKKENNQGNRGGKRGRGGRGGKSRGGKGGSGVGGKEKDQETPDPVEKRKTKTITLPEDQEPFWDREILSPGDVVKIIYPSTSRLGVNKSFIGQAGESSIEDRLVEAAVRAWVSYIVANHNQLNARVQEAPVIKPSHLNDEELTFFSKSMISAWKVMGETEAGRVIEREDIKTTEKDMLKSTVYKSKLRAGNNQEMTFLMKDGTEKSYFIKRPWGEKYGKHTKLTEDEDAEEQPDSSDRAPREHGEGGGKGRGKHGWNRRGQVRDEVPDSSDIFDQTNIESTGSGQAHEIDMDEVQEISLYGREDATRAEIKRDLFILRLLEGRGSLRGPEYKDCEFIRRVWFPTPAQQATGEARKKSSEPPEKQQQHDWMDDSWGDDTDEEEATRKNNAPVPNLVDNDTEDEDLGDDLERNQIVPRLAKKANDSQLRVIGRVTAPNSTGRTRATLVHGPPGTGKTTTIIVAASRLIEAGEPVWIVAQSNVGIRNVAVSLAKRDTNFVLLVAKDFYIWKEDELYKDLKPFLIPTAQLKLESQRKRIHSTKLILCTLASLSSVLVEKFEVFNYVPLRNLIIDEASQIDMTSEFMHLFFNHRHTLKNVCWFGDPLQLPPYGWSEDRKIDDIFKVAHLKANSKLLNVSFRLPVPIANYISEAVYESTLEADLEHDVKKPAEAVLFADVPEGVERREENGTSYMNDAEADLVVKIVQLYFNSEADRESKERFAIITPYEAQRTLLNQKLKEGNINRTAFNVDSYQGNEADYIITTITKTTFSSFLSSINRLNVLITRCRKGLIVLTQKDFILRTGGLLRGLWWSMESHIKWVSSDDVRNGRVKLLDSLTPTRGVPTDQNILDPNAPSTIEVWAVDRSILNDLHVDFILSQLPQTEARIDAPSYRPYVGIDLFYGGDATVKGLVFATQARALVVRLPDNAATTSATLYERNKAKAASDGARKRSKGKSILPDPHRLTPYDRLRKLLEADLAGFGMAQISLTLWDTLRERVGGVNLSSAPFQPLQPATHKIPDPTPRTDANSTGEPTLQDRRVRDGRNKRGSNGSVSGRERREQQHTKSKKPKSIAVHLPEDEKENWDRPIKSPGEVLKLIYESISQLDINSVFIGQPELIDMKTRVEEAVIRAWLSYIAGDKLNSVIQDAPVVKPSRLTDEELHFFSKSMVAAWKVMGERGAGRVIELNEIEDPGVSNKLESKFHKSKIRPGKNQFATFTIGDGVEKPLYMSRAAGNFKQITFREKEEDEKDRKGHDMTNGAESKMDKRQTNVIEDTALGLPTPPEDALFSLEEVQHISVYGREDTTMWEERRDAFILRLLEGRGALHGPGYDDDCEFIRRVWFPTPAQIETGRLRKEKNDPPPGPQRHDWMDDSWGDDTSEDEALRRNNTRAPNLVDYDTEEEDVGHEVHINEMPAQLEGQVNPSQLKVIGRITAPLPGKRVRATLVHGPPGTGKTRTIAGAVIRLVNAGEPVWVAAQSNVGIRNVADKLVEVKFEDFILVVSEEYRVWQNRYSELQRFVISSKSLAMPSKKLIERIRSAKMVLCTLASLSNPQVEKQIMSCVPLRHLIIDEASQIDMTSEFMVIVEPVILPSRSTHAHDKHVFFRYRYCLKSVCWFGDPMQLPPYGWSEDRKIDDIFKVEHLQANSKLLDTSYRLPIPIASFISRDVYSGKLQAWPHHPIKDPIHAVRFIDVSEGEEKKQDHGTSFINHAEADVVVKIAQLYYHNVVGTDENGDPRLYDYEIITPYEAQRLLVVDKLKEVGITKEVYSADSFQGNEADYIITTLTRTNMTSFMKSINRLNVILTRCKRGLVIVTRKDFVLAAGGLLQGLSYSMEKDNIWATAEDASKGCVDLPGVEAPNEYASSEEDE